MANLIPVEGHLNLYRDEKTGAILNCDSIAYEQYINGVNNRKNTKKDIENLKNEISEIKSLLKEILNESRSN